MGGVRPKDNNLFVYMQIVHVSDIQTALETFKVRFYFRATWVQKKSSELADGMINIEASKDWPADVYHPHLVFDNAEEELELKNQTLGVSVWREYDASKYESESANNRPQSQDEFVVMEWKAKGDGKFSNKFDLTHYPCDTQLLKITMSSLDVTIAIHDDHRDNVQSTIRKDYFFGQGFSLLELVSADNAFDFAKEKNKQVESFRVTGLPLTCQEESVIINPKSQRFFRTLSYIIPVKRAVWHVKQEILYPISLISFASMTSFIFPANDPSSRLAQSITVALVMTGYSYIVVGYFPKEKSVFSNYFFRSFLFVFLVVFQNTLISSIACQGWCDSDSDSDSAGQFGSTAVPSVAPAIFSESAMTFGERLLLSSNKVRDSGLLDGSRSKLYDFITMGIFGVVWVYLNGYLYYEILLAMPHREKQRIQDGLQRAFSQYDKVDPLYKSRWAATRI